MTTASYKKLSITGAGKALGLSRSEIFSWMRENRWLIGSLPNSTLVDKGYLVIDTHTITHKNEYKELKMQVRVTICGLNKLRTLMDKNS